MMKMKENLFSFFVYLMKYNIIEEEKLYIL